MTKLKKREALETRVKSESTPYLPTLANMLHHCVQEYGDLLCVIHGEERLTFKDVEARSAELALGLLNEGAGKGTRIGLLMPDGADWIVSFFAISRIGAIPIPISTFNQARELQWVLNHCDAQILLTADQYIGHDYIARLREALPDLKEGRTQYLTNCPYLRSIVVFGEKAPNWAIPHNTILEGGERNTQLTRAYLSSVEANVFPADVGVIIYTSGTTAHPKGVVHSQGAMVQHSYVFNLNDIRRKGEKRLNSIPLFWVGGLVFVLIISMHSGTTVVTPTSKKMKEIIRLIKLEKIEHLDGWMNGFAEMRAHPDFNEQDFDFVKPSMLAHGLFPACDINGDPIPAELTPNMLGQTETLGPHSMCPLHTVLEPEQIGSFGTSIAGVERKIINPQTGETLAAGEQGELCIRGYSVMQGYYKKERGSTFLADGFHRTGDLCVIDENDHLYFVGRDGEMIKTAGANVAPREVETVLMSYDEISEAAVVGVADVNLGQKVVALVVLAKGFDAVDEQNLVLRLRQELSSYKVPKRFVYVGADELPRTSGGKIKKAAILKMPEVQEQVK